jgi:hypothetical protein
VPESVAHPSRLNSLRPNRGWPWKLVPIRMYWFTPMFGNVKRFEVWSTGEERRFQRRVKHPRKRADCRQSVQNPVQVFAVLKETICVNYVKDRGQGEQSIAILVVSREMRSWFRQ